MKNVILIILGIVTLVLTLGFRFGQQKMTFMKKKCSYSVANYEYEIFMKEKYQQRFDSIFQENLGNYFCSNTIENLPRLKHQSVSVEPFFINLDNKDGLYGYRSWNTKGLNPRFVCGYHHYLFLISDNAYYPLKTDSLENVNLVKSKLSRSFSEEEINRMIEWGINTNYYCNNYTYDWPVIIKTDSLELWNIDNELKSTEPNKK